jgi:Kef-type K+ transport system membrane component KefB
MGDEMSKTMSWVVAAAAVFAAGFAFGTGSAGATVQGAALSRALIDSDTVILAQASEQKKKKKKRRGVTISQEHRKKIRETVPQEYQRYLPAGAR